MSAILCQTGREIQHRDLQVRPKSAWRLKLSADPQVKTTSPRKYVTIDSSESDWGDFAAMDPVDDVAYCGERKIVQRPRNVVKAIIDE
jgi:hypothetical protein